MHARVLAIHARLRDGELTGRGRARVLATTLAVLVHLTTLVLVAAGVLVWTTGTFVLVKVIVTVLVATIAWELRPRRHRPKLTHALTRDQAPHAFAVLDAVARVTAAHPPDVIVPTGDFNASYSGAGLRGPRVLTIGLPLWNALDDRERLALLGHECGHDVNGDVRAGFVVGTAMNALALWAWLLRPDGRATRRTHARPRTSGDLFTFAEFLVPVILLPLTTVVGLLALGLGRLAALSGQRAEYRADELSAITAGTDAAVSLLDQTLLADLALTSISAALRSDRNADIWPSQRAFLASVPASQRERLRRAAARDSHRTDASHPPTLLRQDMLTARPAQNPRLQPDADLLRAMTDELFAHSDAIVREMYDAAAG